MSDKSDGSDRSEADFHKSLKTNLTATEIRLAKIIFDSSSEVLEEVAVIPILTKLAEIKTLPSEQKLPDIHTLMLKL